jgi:hypothetical protein
MPVSLEKDFPFRLEPQVICSCGKIIYEIDTMFCSGCGDVTCENCYTDCFDCGKMYCSNCSENTSQCLRCNINSNIKVPDEKAFLVINGVTTPIKNSAFMIQKTSLVNARDIRLTLNGVEYRYTYRSLTQTENDKMIYDYHLYFEEVKQVANMNDEEFAISVRNALRSFNETHGLADEYDDYSTLGW